ncbi:MAG: hypothetical protein GX569_12405 [Candidatus Riflebacteria bacterium]|nr:hypothetical protein [Candidatus Riflebacteria bacterium]
MKVKDLIGKLNAYDPNSEVLCYTEDYSVLDKDHSFKLFVIENLDISEGEPQKGDDNIPTIKFCKSPESVKHVVLYITGSF